ncbi:NAD(P)H-binding protein [Gluconacetobacter aggeris]|uniref:NAD(P)H-binding protein n=2 Tax=Gluconacetobacter aggeris TaxID=1286186 RepID=A0A7W4NX86_9PROT|nr:NAD(P)H-binding protein [Gluconacetobacter aggeris]
MAHRIFLAGGTGLIGRMVAERLSARDDVHLAAPSRRDANGIDYERLCSDPADEMRRFIPDGVEVAISCLGTTIRQARSQAAMYRVDHDYVLAVARGARALGAKRFILMTAAGAGGPGFYLRTKGEIERAVEALRFERVDLIRPGFLLGERTEHRPVEAIGQRLFAALTPLLRGPLSRWGAIPADTVADAIATLALKEASGCFVQENRDLRMIAPAWTQAGNDSHIGRS